MLKRFDIANIFSWIMWGVAIFAYFFQFPISNLAKLIIPCLAAYLVLKVRELKFEKKPLLLCIVFLICLTCSFAVAMAKETSLGRIIRFLFILVAIVYSSFIKVKEYNVEVNVFINIAIGKALLIIAIAIVIVLLGDYSVFRHWALTNGLGDIYFLNRFMPRIQVQGNALLVMAFIVEYIRKKRITSKLCILLIGILFAGNFAYLLGLAFFIAYQVIKKGYAYLAGNKRCLPLAIGLVLIIYLVVMPYLLKQIEQKADVSNQTRIEQAGVLLNANIITGEGLGNYIKASTPTRQYDGDMYFEMQTLYIINQIGIVGILLFYSLVFVNVKKQGIEKVIVYVIYLIYSFWNPYCFDTTQIIATILIINVSTKELENIESSDCNGLLSRRGK